MLKEKILQTGGKDGLFPFGISGECNHHGSSASRGRVCLRVFAVFHGAFSAGGRSSRRGALGDSLPGGGNRAGHGCSSGALPVSGARL